MRISQSILGQWACLVLGTGRDYYTLFGPEQTLDAARAIPTTRVANVTQQLMEDDKAIYYPLRQAANCIQSMLDYDYGFDSPRLQECLAPIAAALDEFHPSWWEETCPSFAYPFVPTPPDLAKTTTDEPLQKRQSERTHRASQHGVLPQRLPYSPALPIADNFPYGSDFPQPICPGRIYFTAPKGWSVRVGGLEEGTERTPARTLADVVVDDYWGTPHGHELLRTPETISLTRIWEINSPADWIELVERFPTPRPEESMWAKFRRRRKGSLQLPPGWPPGWNGRWATFDETAFAREYRGIHVSMWGYLTVSCTPWMTAVGPTVMAGWPPGVIRLYPESSLA